MIIKEALLQITKGKDISKEEMSLVMLEILEGRATDAQIGGLLVALSVKGESIDEVVGAATVMRQLSEKVNVDFNNLVDTCGTGGCGIGIFNVSTTAAFVASACGAKVAKHGNRSATRKSGSADLLEQAGVSLILSPDKVAQCITKIGVGFMFAPAHHSAMRHAVGPRKEMGIKTIFNILGPLTNPAGAPHQIMGVYDKKWLRPMAEVLKELGSEHVLIVHSKDGLDEISIAEETYVAELINGSIKEYTIHPEEFGFLREPLDGLLINSPQESFSLAKDALLGKNLAASSMVAMTAGAALYVSGISSSLGKGILIARESIESGTGMKKLEELASFSRSLI
jgi:anthranilate phosphoribosyltransferase